MNRLVGAMLDKNGIMWYNANILKMKGSNIFERL